jgi:hypothetical protein
MEENNVTILRHALANLCNYTEALAAQIIDLDLTIRTIVTLLQLDWETINVIKQKCKDEILQDQVSEGTEDSSEISGETSE